MDKIKVSICVPVYGVEKYIERCARSLFEQTYKNIEYVFINDSTKDNSILILNKILLEYPYRVSQVRIINHSQNKGLAASRNTAVDNSTGDYLMHVDSDDWIESDTVENCVKEVMKRDYDLVFFDGTVFRNNYFEYMNIPMNISRNDLLVNVLSFNARHNIWGVLIKRQLYVKNNVHAIEGCNMGEDFQVLPLLLYYSDNIFSIGKSLYNYDRRNVQSITYNFSKKNAIQNWQSIDFVYNLFKKLDCNFLDYLEIYKLKTIFFQIKNCILSGSNLDYLDYLMLRLNTINKKYWFQITLLRRIAFYIHNKKLLYIYMLALSKMNILLKFCKSPSFCYHL